MRVCWDGVVRQVWRADVCNECTLEGAAAAHLNASRGANICRLDASFSSMLSAASAGMACACAPASAAPPPQRASSSALSLTSSARSHLRTRSAALKQASRRAAAVGTELAQACSIST